MSLATVATFPNTMLAHIAKGQLNNYGIEAVILHEHFHSTYSFALGEIPVMVPEEQLEQAQQILAENFEEDS
ncbi:DUF2007 domain-containing protein [Kangiella sp. TOML190]|uniref:putative signal transducing protein n=1 Tax=Kangiella sp. TOML190 TaxID=2931351 RepID=UPI00203D8492|nr:DUF2007 domain-containing protein [Kangiella sp. TOML190]